MDSAENEDDDKNDSNDKKPSNKDSAENEDDDKKESNDKKNEKNRMPGLVQLSLRQPKTFLLLTVDLFSMWIQYILY